MKIITLFFTLLISLSLSAETIELVKDGTVSEQAHKQGGWKTSNGALVGSGVGQLLTFQKAIISENFTISAELKLTQLKHTAAGIYLGSSYFGFDGPKGYFTEGGSFKSGAIAKERKISAGKYFTFEAQRKNGQVTISIDGEIILTTPHTNDAVKQVTLRPHRGKMSIKSFSITGDFKEPKKLNHLFSCAKEGYKSYRIPALVTTKKGTLLAFCEGRKHHSHDHGDIDIVLKRSTDNGKTWTPLQIVFDNHGHVAGNAVPIVDQKTGRIHLLSCTSDKHEYAIYKGQGRRGIHSQYSDDDGKTWSKPRDISSNIYPENWRWYATGPCSGIQIQTGKHAGRLVCPANHTYVEEGSDKNIFRAHSIYSDDQGKTWHLGDSSAPGGNESAIAEAGKDLLFHSIRMQSHRQGMRGTRYSKDGGKTWSVLKHDFNLPCPMCQGAVIRDYTKPNRLVHTNPGTSKGRKGMTIRISDDGGKTWPHSKLLLETSSAYSDLSLTSKGGIAVLYEGGHYDYSKEGIIFEVHSKESVVQSNSKKVEAITPASKMGWKIWKDRFNSFNAQAKKGDIDLLLIGDSITHYWQKNRMCKTDGQAVWDKHFKGKKVANFGIGSDRTQHLLYRLKNGNLDGIQPKYAVLMIGTNNATSNHTPYEIYLGTKAIIEEIQQKSPNTKILLYEIFPRIRNGKPAQNRCRQANKLTNALCDGKKVIRCSINKKLLDAEGNPNKAIFFDGIHISAKGYEIWAEDILKHTNK